MNKAEWLASRDPKHAVAAASPWACFGQWLELATHQAGGDISGADLTVWAQWFGDGLSPTDAAIRYGRANA